MKSRLIKEESKEGFSRCVKIRTSSGIGTGVILRTNLVLTCSHTDWDIKPHPRIIDDTEEARLLKRDEELDLMLLSVPMRSVKTIKMARVVKTGDVVYAIGNPLNHTKLISYGRIVDINEKLAYSDIHIAHKSSGSGVYNERGEFVGLVVAYEVDKTIHPFTAIARLDKIQEFIDGFF